MNQKQERRARAAYESYAFAVGNKSHNDEDLPAWRDVSQRIQLAWAIAAKAVADEVKAEIIAASMKL